MFMANNRRGKERRAISSDKGGGVFQNLADRIRLILRLMADPRVHPLLKILPFVSLLYLIIPDLAPGPFDDAAVIWLGMNLFVELCPPEVVQEHMEAIKRVVPGVWHDIDESDPDIIDTEFRVDE